MVIFWLYWLMGEFRQLGKYFIVSNKVAKILMISDLQTPPPPNPGLQLSLRPMVVNAYPFHLLHRFEVKPNQCASTVR